MLRQSHVNLRWCRKFKPRETTKFCQCWFYPLYAMQMLDPLQQLTTFRLTEVGFRMRCAKSKLQKLKFPNGYFMTFQITQKTGETAETAAHFPHFLLTYGWSPRTVQSGTGIGPYNRLVDPCFGGHVYIHVCMYTYIYREREGQIRLDQTTLDQIRLNQIDQIRLDQTRLD